MRMPLSRLLPVLLLSLSAIASFAQDNDQQLSATILHKDNSLTLVIGGTKFPIYAEKEGLFFAKERDLTFEFVKSGNAIAKMVVRENGNIAEELPAVK